MYDFTSLRRTTEPEIAVVSTTTAKAHLRVGHSSEDELIDLYVKAAAASIENSTLRALAEQSWTLTLDAFPAGAIILPRPPLLSVETLSYIDANGDTQEIDGEDLESEGFVVDAASEPGTIRPAYGTNWPTTRAQPNAVTVVYSAGYAVPEEEEDAEPLIPDDIKSAILLMAGHLYENREATTSTPLTALPMAVDALISPWRVLQL